MLAGIKAGASGYLLKDVSLDQLVGAIQTVADGGSLVQPAVTQRLLSGLEHMHNEFVSLDRPDPLTDRETEILRLMAGGFSNKEIANSLGVAEGTIKNHVSNILSKLGRARPHAGGAEGFRAATGLTRGCPGRPQQGRSRHPCVAEWCRASRSGAQALALPAPVCYDCGSARPHAASGLPGESE